MGTGRFERVIEVAQKRLATDPDFMYAHSNLALAYFFFNRPLPPKPRARFRRASERKLVPTPPLPWSSPTSSRRLKGDEDQMERLTTLVKHKQGAEHTT